ncbi:5-oxoprolinase subunit PxpA [Ensifer sp. Root127]|uniref:LamB/YcsF family protein n=1 Tax=Ensifer sp. Root127 TaxID=1736440 RepID=UPI00070C4E5B|nr:5-oxoprolinase subunit PxpA [Ensifer sp. Root127]KQW72405.1 hypothetical protein ASD03_32140 [Ensifer sp. Root127]
MQTTIDLNSDLGEGFGPWRMGDDEAVLGVVTSANIACGGHAGDPATMVETLELCRTQSVVAGAHPGFADREGFGRRLIPLSTREVEQLVATQVGALMGAAALAGSRIQYVKPHGALGNWAADDRAIANAIVRATRAVSAELAILAISGSELENAGREAGLSVFSEIFADRGYLSTGRLVPRSREGAMIYDAAAAAKRLVEFLSTGMMPTVDGGALPLLAHSICVHGDSGGAVAMAHHIRQELKGAGVRLQSFMRPFREEQ